MRRQLIIKIPESAIPEQITQICNITTEAYTYGYPIFLFPGWDYDLVEVTEPMFTYHIGDKDLDNKNKLIDALKKYKYSIILDDCENCKYRDNLESEYPCSECQCNYTNKCERK